MLPRWLVTAITVLITVVWAINVGLGFFAPGRHDPSLNALFAVVVGGLLAVGRKDGGSP